MTDSFIKNQEKLLKNILKGMNKSALFKHLNLQHLLHESHWTTLYDEFVESVPLGNITSYLNTLRAITGDIRAEDAHVLSYPKIIHNKNDLQIATYQGQHYPLCSKQLASSFLVEEMILKGRILGTSTLKGKIFHIFDDTDVQYKSELAIGSFHAIRSSYAPRSVRKQLEPTLKNLSYTGKSRYQKIHAYLTELEKTGKTVEVLMVRPQVLSEIALMLAQREGRPVPLLEICPNLKILVHYGEHIAPYRQSIFAFLKGISCKYLQILTHPSGLLAIQSNLYEKDVLTLSDAQGVFYEFIPVDDLRHDGSLKKHFRRRHAGQVKKGQEYLLALSNGSGLLGYNTEEIVQIHSIEPFTIIYKGKAEKLDYFGEQNNPYLIEKLIENINKTFVNYNFYIREYLIGDHIENHASYWLFELNTDLRLIQETYLQSAANTIFNEMSLHNNTYRQALMTGTAPVPYIYFLPVGSISNIISEQHTNHVDFSEDAATVLNIIEHSADYKKLTPNY